MNRPTCPACQADVSVVRQLDGIATVYPCTCWLPPEQGNAVARELERRSEVRR